MMHQTRFALFAQLRPVAVTLAAGAIGAVAGWLVGAPAPFLTGPAAAVTLISLAGRETVIPLRLRDACFVLIGLAMGAGITPDVVAALPRWPIPLALLSLGLVVIVFAGGWSVERLFGFDRVTARLTAMPGHLSYVLSLSTEVAADVRVVAVIQSLRVLLLTLAVPLAVALLSDADLSMSGVGRDAMGLGPLIALGAAGTALGLVFKRLNWPAALLLGGMAVSGLAHGVGWVVGGPPAWVAIPTFVVMGSLIGTRFSGVTLALLGRAAAASGVLTALSVSVTLAMALLAQRFTGLPLTDLLIAFAPGGLETMAALSILLGTDTALTAAHHVYRLLFLSVLTPIAIASDRRKGQGGGQGGGQG